ncbi:MAG: TonB-dependent receptor [Bryobacteraceae bacterium]
MPITRFALSLLFAACAFPQSEIASATLNGTVTDPTGAAVANAKATVRSLETGFVRSMPTTSAGLYSFRGVPPGTYEVTVEMSGFKSAVRKDITLTVGAVVTVDARLEIGAATETVTVSSETPVIETSRSSTAATVNSASVANLPLNGRSFIDLALLTPGVVKDPTRGGDFSFGGQRGPNNAVTVDGADSNNLFYGQATGRTGLRPPAFSQGAVQEFQVSTNSFPAEQGRASGGVINVITRSGTNQFHGEAFEFYRDKGMNANIFINNRNGARKNPYHFNQFGGTLGGPVKRDKLFFFLSYDGQRNKQSQVVVPNITPPGGASGPFGKYLTPYLIGLQNNLGLVKMDWNISDRERLSVRYNMSRYTGLNQESFGSNIAEEHSGNNEVNTDNLAATYNRTFGSNVVVEGRFNLVQDKQPGYANTKGPEVNIINGIVFGANNFSPRYTNTYAYQPTANVSWLRSRHAFKFGFDFNFLRAENYFPGFFAGGFTFNSYDDFLNQRPSQFRQSFPGSGTEFPISRPDVNEWAFFAQDTWRVTDRLTLNYGLRYDYFAFRQPDYNNPNAGLAAANLRTDRIPTDKKNLGPRFGFAYRVTQSEKVVVRGGYGIYYGRTPGLLLSTAILNNGFASAQYLVTSNIPTYPNVLKAAPGPGTPPDIYVTDPNFKTPRTQQFSLQTEIAVGGKASVTLGYLGVNGTHLTRTRDINLFPSVPTAGFFCPTFAACTAAQGTPMTFARHPGTAGPARPNPAFGRISLFDSGGNSIYHGGFVHFQRRFAQNFQVQASYTLSKVIDTTPDGTSVVPGNAGDDAKVAQDTLLPNLDRGPGLADIRHRLVLSGNWDIAYGNKAGNRAMRTILGYWHLGLLTQAQSGRAFYDITTGDPGNDSNTANDRSPGVGRNTIRGPEFATVDVRVSKDIPVWAERVRLQLIGEAFNIPNRANINGMLTTRYTYSGGAFRPLFNPAVPSTTFGWVQSTFDPRILQLAVKLIF